MQSVTLTVRAWSDAVSGSQAVYVLACVVAGSEQLRRWVVGSSTLIGALKLAIVSASDAKPIYGLT